ncbi:MAG: hypothetical protein ACRC6B_00235 [Fusobacteriaceae bacterium]
MAISMSNVFHTARPQKHFSRDVDLWVGNIGDGTFTLNRSFYDFDYVYFITAPDNDDSYSSHIFYRDELEFMRVNYPRIEICGSAWYWQLNMAGDRRTCSAWKENSRIRRVYGGWY